MNVFLKKIIYSKNNDFIEIKNEKYYFKKIGIIYVSIRLGLNSISKEYYKSLKELFLCKYCLGINWRERKISILFYWI